MHTRLYVCVSGKMQIFCLNSLATMSDILDRSTVTVVTVMHTNENKTVHLKGDGQNITYLKE